MYKLITMYWKPVTLGGFKHYLDVYDEIESIRQNFKGGAQIK